MGCPDGAIDRRVDPETDELTPEELETIRRIGDASRTRIIAILSMPDQWNRLYTGRGKENLK